MLLGQYGSTEKALSSTDPSHTLSAGEPEEGAIAAPGAGDLLANFRLLERLEAPDAKPAETRPEAAESKPAATRAEVAESKPSTTRAESTGANPTVVTAPPPEAASTRESPTEDLRAFLTGLGLAHLEPRFIEQELELSVMLSLSLEELKEDLAAVDLSVGARRKIIKGIEQRASAAKKEAALKAAEDQVIAATVQKEHDEQQLKAQREEIEKLRKVIEERGKPADIVCPITHDIMLNPVVAADGHTYERAQIEAWLRTHDRSPLTNAVLAHKHLTTNEIARRMVKKFIEECRRAGRNPHA